MYRYFVYTVLKPKYNEKYIYIVCDGSRESGEKTIAKFKDKKDAEHFCNDKIRQELVNEK